MSYENKNSVIVRYGLIVLVLVLFSACSSADNPTEQKKYQYGKNR